MTLSLRISQLKACLAECMASDRARLARRLRVLAERGAADALEKLTAEMELARARRARRLARLPQAEFPDELPVARHRDEIAAAIAAHQVVVVCGDTGSGKTTQLPKICLALGRGVDGLIGHTQPRRIAARSVSERIAQELATPLGEVVGYQVRFGDRVGADAYVKLMTDGILLAETGSDRLLLAYDTLIIDEAHERSLNIDFLIGYLKRILPRRPDLKLVITSATIDPERFARHFDNAPIVRVPGRSHPVEMRYRPMLAAEAATAAPTLADAVTHAVGELAGAGSGDVLVFLPGEREIRDCAEALRKQHPAHCEILPLYARLSAAEQSRIFSAHGTRRIVLATNVAETSLTVPGIRYVVDSGLARIARYSHRTQVQRLPIERIARASADQRAGRCGRVAPGICVRLYEETDYLNAEDFTPPEILRTSLAAVILRMLALRLGAVEDFPFLDPPDRRYVSDAYRQLHELGAVDAARALTPLGQQLARLPVEPRIGRMLLAAATQGALTEVLIIAAALSVVDPRERPYERQAAADQMHARFSDPRSDFLAWLKLWRYVREQARHLSQNKLRALCAREFLSWMRLREWQDVHAQLTSLCKDMGLRLNELEAEPEPIHRALLTGLLGQVAQRHEAGEYLGARGGRLRVHPSSALCGKPSAWLMAAELVETTRLYARNCARIEPEWIEQAAAHLVKRHYDAPHWERRRGEAVAFERVSLYGLTLATQRKVGYARIDPVASRALMILHALVRDEYPGRPPAFLAHNRRLIESIEAEEARLRRRDRLPDEEALCALYAARIPEDVVTVAALEHWLRQSGDARLRFTREGLLQRDDAADIGIAFPEHLSIAGARLALVYRFEPGADDDGVTLLVPLPALNSLDAARLEWLVPGMIEDKVVALIRGLPKALRRHCVPAAEFARAATQSLAFAVGALPDALARELVRMTGASLSAGDFNLAEIPAHLRMNLRVQDGQGRVVAEGRDLALLRGEHGASAQASFAAVVAVGEERSGLQHWDCDDLPETMQRTHAGTTLTVFPALVDERDSVALRLLATREEAARAHRAGLRRLYLLALPQRTRYLQKQLPGFDRLCLHYAQLAPAPWAEPFTTAEPCAALRDELLLAVSERVFFEASEPPRGRAAFESALHAGEGRLVGEANALCALLAGILPLHHALRLRLPGIKPAATRADIEAQLARLVYRGFVLDTPAGHLMHLSRYLKALQLRLDKLAREPGRDAARLAELAPHMQRIRDYRPADAAPAFSEYRWLLEELRVSVFAQELGTAVKVSVQRLEKLWQLVTGRA